MRYSLSGQVNDSVSLKHLCLFTHNCADFTTGQARENSPLFNVTQTVAMLPGIAEEFSLEIVGASARQIRDAFLESEKG
jgi:hypothetical protein